MPQVPIWVCVLIVLAVAALCGALAFYDRDKMPYPAHEESPLAAAGAVCAFAGIRLCVCRKDPLGLGAGGRHDGRPVPDVYRHF